MDLSQIADRSGLTIRKLRYVLDHGLLPGGKMASQGRGAGRHFTPFEAFGIATAALMLEAGVKRAPVRDCLATLVGPPRMTSSDIPLYRAFSADQTARLEIGDWTYVRLIGTGSLATMAFDTGWLPLAGHKEPVAAFAPLVTITLDVGQIRRSVRTSS